MHAQRVLSLPRVSSIAVSAPSSAKRKELRRIARDLEGRTSIVAIAVRGRVLIVTVRTRAPAADDSMPLRFEAALVAQAIYHGPVRFRLENAVQIVYQRPNGTQERPGTTWTQPYPARRGPSIGLAKAARRAGFSVLGLRRFGGGLGAILVLRAGEPAALVRSWDRMRRARSTSGLATYLEIQNRCGRVVVAGGGGAGVWTPIIGLHCRLWGCPPRPMHADPPPLLTRWAGC